MKRSSSGVSKKTVFQRIGWLTLLLLIAGSVAYPAPANWLIGRLTGLAGVSIPQIDLPYVLGLDLQGGTHLEYEADIAQVAPADRTDALNGVRDVIERRVNTLGVSEPLIQTTRAGDDWRVTVELAGIRDVNQAITLIGETPILEFKEENPEASRGLTADERRKLDEANAAERNTTEDLIEAVTAKDADFAVIAARENKSEELKAVSGDVGFIQANPYLADLVEILKETPAGQIHPEIIDRPGEFIIAKVEEIKDGDIRARLIVISKTTERDIVPQPEPWRSTQLTGKQLESSRVEFDPQSGAVQVSLQFDSEGGDLFAELTRNNLGKQIAIFLDGQIISAPVVQSEILGGRAVISGNFNVDEAKVLSRRLQAGALPIPIKLIAQQSVGPTLGADSLQASLLAGLIGFALVALFMLLMYRVPGVAAIVALILYAALSIAVFKLLPVTLTLAGIAGFILSIGIAVDANVLVFERLKEELKLGKTLSQAMEDSFRRAWLSIRDGHVTILISCAVLFWFSSSIIKGFALTLGFGTLLSLFTAVVTTRTILRALVHTPMAKQPWLFLKSRQNKV